MSGYEEAEAMDGLRLSWNVWPTTRLEAVKMVVPLAVSYTPLIRADEVYKNRCEYSPVQCKNERCKAIISPWGEIDHMNKLWACPLCLTRNHFPPNYTHITPDNLPLELQVDSTTIEYETLRDTNYNSSPTFLFIIDTILPEEKELDEIKSSISQALELLPQDSMVGIITFGKHVSIHEIGYNVSQMQNYQELKESNTNNIDQNGNQIEIEEPYYIEKSFIFRGDIDINNKEKLKEITVDKIKSLLEINPNNSQSILRFLSPISEAYDVITNLLENITRDEWKVKDACRPMRCTGMAILCGIALLEGCIPGHPARMMVFSGGAPTCGVGKIVEPSLADHLRGHRQIVRGKAPLYEPAAKFYMELANHAVNNGHVIDLFACCLDQTGVAEQRSLCDMTGGTITLSDTFTTSVFTESFRGIFMWNENENLAMVFNGEISVRCSRQIKVQGCIGAVTGMNEKSSCVSNNEIGSGNTSKWSCGGMFPQSTYCFIFDIAANQNADDVNTEEFGHIQFITTYRTSFCTNVIRVTTFSIEFANPTSKKGLDSIIASYDSDAAAVILAKIAVWKADTEFSPELMRWLDQQLIKLVSKFAQYQSGDPESFALPEQFVIFPQYIFYLRRSQFIQVFNCSPDETAFFRSVLLRENTVNGLSMIQPLLHSYSTETEDITPELLELSSIGPEKILVLDTFFHFVVWYGKSIAEWRNNKIWEENNDYEWFKELLKQPKHECLEQAAQRFPYPNIIECDEGSGQQRFLIAKLDPPDDIAAEQHRQQDPGLGDVHSDDVSLKVFMNHLKRLAVNPP